MKRAFVRAALLAVVGWAAQARGGERYKATVGHAPARGPADAKVTIVVFADYQCPFCAKLLPVLEQLLAEHRREVRLAWRQRPLDMHPDAILAAEAALAAREQGKFWEMQALLYAHQDALARPDLEKYGQTLGLDRKRFAAALDGHKFVREIEKDSEAGVRIGAYGTPTLFVNGRLVRGFLDHDALRDMIAEEITEADALMRKGTSRAGLYERILSGARSEAPREGASEPDPTVYQVEVGDAPTRGPAAAPVTIVEFGDFQCPFCARVEPTLTELRRLYGKKLRIVWKDSPMGFHPQALLAAEAARVAGDQGKFWPMHDRLLALQEELGLTTIEKAAASLGLDMARFRKTLDEGRHRPHIERDVESGQKLGVEGTPTFFINGRKLMGALPIERFRELIDQALGR
ncbi:MAG TPA: thioredoxin domain-containing protein [Polyangia bacterium]|nr:thioredoxin domain-containing protein [Polyangia bacterium]